MKYLKKNNEEDNKNKSDQERDSYDDNDNSAESDNYDEFKPKKEKRSHKNLGSIAKSLLEEKKQSLPSKRDKQGEIAEVKHRELLSKKKAKRKQRLLGYVSELSNWKTDEKLFKKIATKGVVKLFNSIYDIKKRIVDEHKQEAIVKEKKSKNFLMMHDLVAPTVSKSFKEDK